MHNRIWGGIIGGLLALYIIAVLSIDLTQPAILKAGFAILALGFITLFLLLTDAFILRLDMHTQHPFTWTIISCGFVDALIAPLFIVTNYLFNTTILTSWLYAMLFASLLLLSGLVLYEKIIERLNTAAKKEIPTIYQFLLAKMVWILAVFVIMIRWFLEAAKISMVR